MNSFEEEVKARIRGLTENEQLKQIASNFLRASVIPRYSYNFSWLGRPIIQYPQDIIAMQEIIWNVQPEIIVETGIAHGGSLIFYASMLELVALCTGSEGLVLGVDVEIRSHNRQAIEAHPLSRRIQMIEGSSVAAETIAKVRALAKDKRRVLVCLDSNHTHQHVLEELNAYASLVTKDSYCVVFDTLIEDMPKELYPDRPWGPGDNPKTAVHAYLRQHPEFQIESEIHEKLLITVSADGFLKRIQ
jgi:cephalosporin hydroxylase